jgi:uncharacterized protein YndB with AHSA1/START domain
MESKGKTAISVNTVIAAPIEKVWKCWTSPGDIIGWNHASDDWHTTHADNDLREGGYFSYRMEAKDGSVGFDFGGIYDQIVLHKRIDLILGDDRKVRIIFSDRGNTTEIVEIFEAENTNPVEMQRFGWQAILDNFKKHTEAV